MLFKLTIHFICSYDSLTCRRVRKEVGKQDVPCEIWALADLLSALKTINGWTRKKFNWAIQHIIILFCCCCCCWPTGSSINPFVDKTLKLSEVFFFFFSLSFVVFWSTSVHVKVLQSEKAQFTSTSTENTAPALPPRQGRWPFCLFIVLRSLETLLRK